MARGPNSIGVVIIPLGRYQNQRGKIWYWPKDRTPLAYASFQSPNDNPIKYTYLMHNARFYPLCLLILSIVLSLRYTSSYAFIVSCINYLHLLKN